MSQFLAGLLLMVGMTSAFGDDLEDLKSRFRARYSQLEQLKLAGLVGETEAGLVEAVKTLKPDQASVVRAENADRVRLYAILAGRERTTPDLVARRNALRNFANARSGAYLKKGGVWTRK